MVNKRLVLCVTGSSGAVYAASVMRRLSGIRKEINVIFSDNGKKVFEFEIGQKYSQYLKSLVSRCKLVLHDNNDLFSPLASGSSDFDVLVCPCSMGTIGRISAGISSTLIERVCDVALKERNRLVCVIRESPLSMIHINNMRTLIEAGALIMPASPFFYHKPETMDDLIDQFTDRVLKEVVDGYVPDYIWKG